MSIPIEAKSFVYTPECLVGMAGAPKFTIRYGTRRDRHTYQDEVRLRRLRSHDKADFRAAFLSELRTKWAGDGIAIDEVADAMERYFAALDEFEANVEAWRKDCEPIFAANQAAQAKGEPMAELPPLPEIEFDPVEREKVETLMSDIEDHSDKIGRMHKDNGKREREIRRAALAVLLDGSSLDIPLTRTIDGMVNEDALYAIEDALDTFSDNPDHSGGLAFLDLGTKALLSFFLTGEEEKNSPSPVPTTGESSGSTRRDKTSSTMATSTPALPGSDADPIPAEPTATSATAT